MKTFAFLAIVAAQTAAINFGSGVNSYTLDIHYDSVTSEIVIVSTQPDQTWFGIMLGGNTMTNTESIVFIGNGASSSTSNGWSTGHAMPTAAATQSLTTTVTTATAPIKMTTRRRLNPNHTNQFVIPLDTDISMAFAGCGSTNDITTQHDESASWTLRVPADGTTANKNSVGTGAGNLAFNLALVLSVAAVTLF